MRHAVHLWFLLIFYDVVFGHPADYGVDRVTSLVRARDQLPISQVLVNECH